MNNTMEKSKPRFWRTRTGLGLIAFLVVGAGLLLLEHRAHIPGDYWLLGGLLAFCIGMHGFMHGGHRSHGNDRSSHQDDSSIDSDKDHS